MPRGQFGLYDKERTVKYCYGCSKGKPLEQFYQSDEFKSRCKECRKKYYREYHEKRKIESAKQSKIRRDSLHPSGLTQGKVDHLMGGYGMTPEQYLKLIHAQQGKCACCDTILSENKRYVHIDHDHETGRIRGILCHSCNLMLGHADENIDKLKKAIFYLERNK